MEQYRYSYRELTDIHLVYGEVRSNALAAERLYRERFPNRHHPSRRMFISLDRRMRETGSLQRSNEGAGNMRSTRTPDFEEEVLARVAADPTTSARRISRAMGASHSSVWRVIHEQQLHPYHPQRVHALLVTDFAPRVALCQWIRCLDFFQSAASFRTARKDMGGMERVLTLCESQTVRTVTL